ncbi:hypothetical protein FGG78_26265, partial [Thioclava sp. BHET1]
MINSGKTAGCPLRFHNSPAWGAGSARAIP